MILLKTSSQGLWRASFTLFRMCWQPDKGLRHLPYFLCDADPYPSIRCFLGLVAGGWWIHKSLWEYAGLRTCVLFLSQAVVPRTSANVRSGGLRLALSAKDKGWHTSSGISLTTVAVFVQSLSCVWLSANPWTVALQASPSVGFSRQEYWSGLPFPSPGDLSNPGVETESPALAGRFFTAEPPGKPDFI